MHAQMEMSVVTSSSSTNVWPGHGELGGPAPLPPSDYEQFVADVWVGVALTLMVFSCLCCMCSCMLYHRFQEWKRAVLAAAAARENAENGNNFPDEALPTYTFVSGGLPSYDEALQQWRAARIHRKSSVSKMAQAVQAAADKTPPPLPLRRLSVLEFLLKYKGQRTIPCNSMNVTNPEPSPV